jgi:hypothetical protein
MAARSGKIGAPYAAGKLGENFLAEPDSLATIAADEPEAMDGELLEYAADDAYRKITGKQLRAGGGHLYADPAGEDPTPIRPLCARRTHASPSGSGPT